MKRLAVLAFALAVLGCASGDPLREQGFTATPAGSGTWWVSYEGNSMSTERARDALLYNTARLVLDNGAIHFTFEESKVDSRFDSEQTSSVDDEPSPGNPTGESYRAATSLQRVTVVSAIAKIVDAPGEGALDASKVLEELTRKYTR